MNFGKSFNIGLMLDSTTKQYESFLNTYGRFIHSVYFSLPLGRRFHSRGYIANQFEKIENIKKFWDIIDIVNDYGIALELVLNTWNLNKDVLYAAVNLLAQRKVNVEFINIIDEYYDAVVDFFPNAKYVYSYNNFLNDISQIPDEHNYEYIVVGGKNIRNFSMHSQIHQRSKVILLLNNGCNHYCGWCSSDSNHCVSMFKSALNLSSIEYLYALQSIMPFEIHSNLTSLKESDLYKINCRNANMDYLINCLSSYINNYNFELIEKDGTSCLSYWARLAWFEKSQMDTNKIMKFKQKIYKGVKYE